MTFPEFWHLITTSRYTRELERQVRELRRELSELKAENVSLIVALGKRPAIATNPENGEAHDGSRLPLHTRRPGFSQQKRLLENQPERTQRSVTP